jgi:hypothetical protein
MWFGYGILKIYFVTKQVLLNDFGIKFFSLSVVTNGVQCGVFLDQLSLYYAFYTATNIVHHIFVRKPCFGVGMSFCPGYSMDIPLLIPGNKIIAPLLSPAQEVKLVRPLNSFFF